MSNLFRRIPGKAYPIAVRAQGCDIWDQSGKRYLDASGGACVVTIGHGVRDIAKAVAEQMESLSFVHGSHFVTGAACELAARIAGLSADPHLNRVYLVSGGSEAVETAVKLARQYWREAGRPDRYKVLSRWTSYHGNTMGALALGGHTGRRRHYLPLMLHTPHIEPCYCYRCPFGRDRGSCGLECAHALERTLLYEGPDSVAAFIAEPVVGASAGALVPPPGYWPLIREICDRHSVLLISDEVMTGAGRTGLPLALDHWGVAADLVALAKGLSSGYAPLGAVLCRESIHEVIKDGSGEFVHGFTYCQHPVAAAAGVAVLRHLEENKLVERSREMGKYLLQRLLTLKDSPLVGDVRGLGLLAALEFVADKERKTTFDPAEKVAGRVAAKAFALGLITYPGSGGADGMRGDHLLLCPPFIIKEEEIDFLVDTVGAACRAVERELSRR